MSLQNSISPGYNEDRRVRGSSIKVEESQMQNFSYELLEQNLPKIRTILNLDNEIFSELPNKLLVVPFDIINKTKYQYFSYIGDSVLELIIRKVLFDRREKLALDLSVKLEQYLISSHNLHELLKLKEIHGLICPNNNFNSKMTHRIFRSIIGVIFHYLNDIKQDIAVLSKISDWLFETFPTLHNIDNLLVSEVNDTPSGNRVILSDKPKFDRQFKSIQLPLLSKKYEKFHKYITSNALTYKFKLISKVDCIGAFYIGPNNKSLDIPIVCIKSSNIEALRIDMMDEIYNLLSDNLLKDKCLNISKDIY